MNLQSIVEEIRAKGFGPDKPVTESSLRQVYGLPSWVIVPPLFVELVNEHLGTITVGPEQEETPPDPSPDGSGPDIFDIFIDLLGGVTK